MKLFYIKMVQIRTIFMQQKCLGRSSFEKTLFKEINFCQIPNNFLNFNIRTIKKK